jgi:hypothetical protein
MRNSTGDGAHDLTAIKEVFRRSETELDREARTYAKIHRLNGLGMVTVEVQKVVESTEIAVTKLNY